MLLTNLWKNVKEIHIYDRLKIFVETNLNFKRLPPSQQSAFLQFHLPSNSHEMMVTEFSSQQENLSQR